jgi:amino acid adenylation domain-containing protein
MTDLRNRIAALSPEQRARFEARVAGLAADAPAASMAIAPRDRERPTPLSFAQQREWAVEQFRPANNVTGALRLAGDVDLGLLARVMTEVMARHEVLRSTVAMTDRGPVQVVQPVTPVVIDVEDLRGLDEAEQDGRIRRRCEEEMVLRFPPESTQRLRAAGLRVADDAYVVVVTLDHAASDAWSLMIALREMAVLYPALSRGDGDPLPPLPIQYGDFAVWERERLTEERMAAELAHWKTVLADMPPRLALPSDRSPKIRRTFEGGHHNTSIGAAPTAELRRFAESEGASLSMVVLAVCSVLLHRYTGQDDQVFGSAVGGRTRPETEDLIGCFANALPLRMRVARTGTLRETLRQANEVVSAAFDHQELPFDRLIEELSPQEAARTPLIQMMVNVLSAPVPDQMLDLPGLQVTHRPVDPGPIMIDLVLVVQAGSDSLHFDWHYSAELFDHSTVEGLAAQLLHVLEQLVTTPDRRVCDVTLMDESVAAAPAPAEAVEDGFVDLFQLQVAGNPDSAAVVCDGVAVTYAELNRDANRLAHQLRGLGVGPETRVGVLIDRSPALLTAVLGVLKAGGAFVPLDPALPADRIRYLTADAQTPVVVTVEASAAAIGHGGPALVHLDRLPDQPDHDPVGTPASTDAAYVIYTSGSTGQPKGVVIEHRSLAVFARDVADRLQLGAGDRFLQFASPGFDVLVEELFPVWLAGGAVAVPPAGAGMDLVEVVARNRVTVVELPAAYWHEWVRTLERDGTELPGTLRLVIVGAERVLPERLETWRQFGVPLMNVYGITETTVSSTFFRLPAVPPPDDIRHLPIGTALPSVELRILDDELRPVPPGAVGELYLGGVGVGRGYLDRPGLTAQRFVADPDPTRPGRRVYRSGDLVRRRADGNLEFLSRADAQIKIRGFRVEPAEIESALCRHPLIAQAVVSVHEPAPGDRRLVAHLVARDGTLPDVADLRRFLGRELPAYLIPAVYLQVAEIPLTPNGKVDHDLLPRPDGTRPELAEELVRPQSTLERRLAAVFAEVLDVDSVGANDDFFDLGGDSILAIMVVSRAREDGIELTPIDVFERRTVAQLAAITGQAATPQVILPRSPDAEPVLSFDQERLWLEDQLVPGAAYNVGWQQRLRGPLDLAVVEASLRAVLERHETLRSRFPSVDGRVVQLVEEHDPRWRPRFEDFSGMPDGEQRARALLSAEVATGFDLANGPLQRCLLIRLGPEDHVLSFLSHHIVADVSSVGLFVRELALLYSAGGDPAKANLPDLPVQYLDYAVWQREKLAGEELDRQVEYWRQHLAGAPRALTMPSIRHAAATRVGGRRVYGKLSATDTAGLRRLCKAHDVTPFMVVLAMMGAVLGRWAGQRDVVVGVSSSTRTHAETEGLIGSFINTLPMRVDMAGDPVFVELLDRVRRVALDAQAHADAPLDVIMKRLDLPRDPRRTPLFQVMLNVIDVPTVRRFGEITLEEVLPPPLQPAFDLVLTTNEVDGEFTYTLEHDANRFSLDMITTLADHIGAFLSGVVADPELGILDYALDAATEDEPALAARPIPTLDRALAWQAARQPERIAVVDARGAHTYRWLDAAAERIAATLTARSVEHVSLVRQPSAAFTAAVAGCVAAGVPMTVVEPQAPAAAGSTVLDAEGLTAWLAGLTGLARGANREAPAADWAVERHGLGPDDRFAVVSNSAGHLLAALTSAVHAGGILVLPGRPPTADTGALGEWLAANGITAAYTNPPLLRAMTGQLRPGTLRHVFVENTGDLIAQDVAALRTAAPDCRLTAVYRTGPNGRPLATATIADNWQLDTAPLRVPIGTELDRGSVRLLRAAGRPAAVGEVARIHDTAGPSNTSARQPRTESDHSDPHRTGRHRPRRDPGRAAARHRRARRGPGRPARAGRRTDHGRLPDRPGPGGGHRADPPAAAQPAAAGHGAQVLRDPAGAAADP